MASKKAAPRVAKTKTYRTTRSATSTPRTYAAEILKLEAKAVEGLSALLNEDFDRAVELIMAMSPEGRVVVSGMGKAGFVAMKISATLASTGVPSYFLHPAEAIHGDLGRYTKKDIAMLLSNSGETQETIGILPHVRRIGCPVISITSDKTSTLGKHSDIVLPIGLLDEAGPFGLAPTTSTTAMLALGDALAVTILKLRDFSKEQFALYHPGGNIGRGLMLISEVMRSGEENCVVPETMKAKDVLHKITVTKGRPGATAIVDKSGKLVGVFTDGNLRRCLEKGDSFLNLPISKVMGSSPKTIAPTQIAQEALRIMSEHKIDQLIVVDADRRPIGMIDIQDLIDIRLR
ncbi:MAG: KpsF/GutQ family sugar-phosphate isomerase [Deltaproteobacteria bacterium]|nr:KpsF/GutQ family sugar-phosphate isomerase [Deltaproteobacteria bacterium]